MSPRALLLAAALVAISASAAEPAPASKAEIQHLLDYLGSSGCQFFRNGGWHSSADARDHVFDRFFRVDTARTVSIGTRGRVTGTGLGLPIARWIAERHDGTLELSEASDTRTTFALRLPVTPVLERAH